MRGMIKVIADQYLGLESLALASLAETPTYTSQIIELPDIPDLA